MSNLTNISPPLALHTFFGDVGHMVCIFDLANATAEEILAAGSNFTLSFPFEDKVKSTIVTVPSHKLDSSYDGNLFAVKGHPPLVLTKSKTGFSFRKLELGDLLNMNLLNKDEIEGIKQRARSPLKLSVWDKCNLDEHAGFCVYKLLGATVKRILAVGFNLRIASTYRHNIGDLFAVKGHPNLLMLVGGEGGNGAPKFKDVPLDDLNLVNITAFDELYGVNNAA